MTCNPNFAVCTTIQQIISKQLLVIFLGLLNCIEYLTISIFIMIILLGLTGGLAAPLLVPIAGTVIGATGAAALGSTAGVAIIGSLFGAAGAGLGGMY